MSCLAPEDERIPAWVDVQEVLRLSIGTGSFRGSRGGSVTPRHSGGSSTRGAWSCSALNRPADKRQRDKSDDVTERDQERQAPPA